MLPLLMFVAIFVRPIRLCPSKVVGERRRLEIDVSLRQRSLQLEAITSTDGGRGPPAVRCSGDNVARCSGEHILVLVLVYSGARDKTGKKVELNLQLRASVNRIIVT